MTITRRKIEVGTAYELIVFEALRRARERLREKFNIKFYLKNELPVVPDLVIPEKEILLLVQHQLYTNDRYPFYNKIDQLIRLKSAGEIKFAGKKVSSQNLKVISIFIGRWTSHFMKIAKLFYDYVIIRPELIFGKTGADKFLNLVEEFSVQEINLREFSRILQKSDEELIHQFAEAFINSLKEKTQYNLNILINHITEELKTAIQAPKNVLFETIWKTEAIYKENKEKYKVKQIESDIRIYQLFYNLLLIKGYLRFFALLYELIEERQITSINQIKSLLKDDDVDRKLLVLNNLGYIKLDGNYVKITTKGLDLLSNLNTLDAPTRELIFDLINECLKDPFTKRRVKEIQNPELIDNQFRLLKNSALRILRLKNAKKELLTKLLNDTIKREIDPRTGKYTWFGVDLLCIAFGLRKEMIPEIARKYSASLIDKKILKTEEELSELWPNVTPLGIIELNDRRISALIELFYLYTGGFKNALKKLCELDIKKARERLIAIRKKQLVAKIYSPLKIFLIKILDEIGCKYIDSPRPESNDIDTSLIEMIKRKCQIKRLGYSSVFPRFDVKIPLTDGRAVFIYCKADLTGSNEGFVRAKMRLSRYYVRNDKIFPSNNELVLITDRLRGNISKEKFAEAGIRLFQLNSIGKPSLAFREYLLSLPLFRTS